MTSCQARLALDCRKVCADWSFLREVFSIVGDEYAGIANLVYHGCRYWSWQTSMKPIISADLPRVGSARSQVLKVSKPGESQARVGAPTACSDDLRSSSRCFPIDPFSSSHTTACVAVAAATASVEAARPWVGAWHFTGISGLAQRQSRVGKRAWSFAKLPASSSPGTREQSEPSS